ncbi:MAG TPA: G8 domain-containing protein, partial [Thermoanaerobaculia bacterium]
MRNWTLLLLLLCASVASGATIQSNGGQNLDWSSSSTWEGEVVPGNGDDVVIGSGSQVVVNNQTAVTVASVSVSAGGPSGNEPASLLVAGTLTITSALSVIGGTPSAEPATGGFATLTLTGTVIAGSIQIVGGAGSSFGSGGDAGIWLDDDAATLKSAGNVSLSSQFSTF